MAKIGAGRGILFLALLLEDRVAAHIVLDVDGGRSEELLSALLDAAYHSGLRGDGGAVGDREVPDYADLARDDAVLADLGGAGDAGLRGHHGVVSDLDIVRDLAEIVDLDAIAYDGGLHFRAVDSGIGSYLDVVADDDVAEVLDLLPRAVWLRGIAEAVRAYHAVGVEDHPVADHHPGIDAYAGVEDAALADGGAVADIDILIEPGAVADAAFLSDVGEAADIDLLSELCRGVDPGQEAAVVVELAFVVVNVLEQECDGRVRVVHADEGGRDFLLGNEVLVYDDGRRLGLVDVVLIFGIGVEAELSGLAVLDLCEGGDFFIGVAVHGPLEDTG